MDFYMRLPRNKREFVLFMAIISVVSVNIIAPLITCFEFGFSLDVWADVLTVIPFLWPAVIVLVLLTYRPAEWLTGKIAKHGDSFHSTVTINILCSVFLLSVLLTVIGTWIGGRRVSMEPVIGFFHKWPRNFTVSFGVELLIAQPLARFVMMKYHQYTDAASREKRTYFAGLGK